MVTDVGSASATPSSVNVLLAGVVEQNHRLLVDLLAAFDDRKAIVWDRALMKRFSMLLPPKVFVESHGVVSHLSLDAPETGPNVTSVLYLLTPTTATVQRILAVLKDIPLGDTKRHAIRFVPDIPLSWKEHMQRGDLIKKVHSVDALELRLWPLGGRPASGALELCEPRVERQLLIDRDWTALSRIAQAVAELDARLGGATALYAHGTWSSQVAVMVCHFRKQPPHSVQRSASGRIVLIDRWSDPLTPLLPQFSYGGMLDSEFGISHMNGVKVAEREYQSDDVVTIDQADALQGTPTKDVSVADDFFDSLQGQHFTRLAAEVQSALRQLKQEREVDRSKMSIAEVGRLVKSLPAVERRQISVQKHMRLTEMLQLRLWHRIKPAASALRKEILEKGDGDRVLAVVEDSLQRVLPIEQALAMICAQSLWANGLRPSVQQQYRRMLTQTYGVEAVAWMTRLQLAGLIVEKAAQHGRLSADVSAPDYSRLSKSYSLLADEYDINSIEALFDGVTPLLVRHCMEGSRADWRAPGWRRVDAPAPLDNRPARSCDVIVIVGCASRTEIAALQQALPSKPLIVVASTTHSSAFLQSFR